MPKRQKLPKLYTRAIVSVPLREPDARRLQEAAQRAGQAVSAFIRDAALAKAADVLGDDCAAPAAA